MNMNVICYFFVVIFLNLIEHFKGEGTWTSQTKHKQAETIHKSILLQMQIYVLILSKWRYSRMICLLKICY